MLSLIASKRPGKGANEQGSTEIAKHGIDHPSNDTTIYMHVSRFAVYNALHTNDV